MAILSLHGAVSAEPVSQPPAQQQPCHLVRMESLDIDTLPSGLIAAPVSLNGKPFRLLVDTGSVSSSIDPEIAAELNLRTVETPFGGMFLNGVKANRFGLLDSMTFGQLHSARWPIMIAPDGLLPVSVAGMLGPDVMSNYDIEFDFAAGKMNFFTPNTCVDPVYWTDGYSELPIDLKDAMHVVAEATLDGKPVRVVLDTGSSTSTMSLDAARRLYGWRDDDPQLKYDGDLRINGGAAAPIYHYPFSSLNFGGVAVQKPKIDLIPQANFDPHSRRADIVLGMSVIRQLHLLIAYRQAKLFVTAAEAPPPTTPTQLAR